MSAGLYRSTSKREAYHSSGERIYKSIASHEYVVCNLCGDFCQCTAAHRVDRRLLSRPKLELQCSLSDEHLEPAYRATARGSRVDQQLRFERIIDQIIDEQASLQSFARQRG